MAEKHQAEEEAVDERMIITKMMTIVVVQGVMKEVAALGDVEGKHQAEKEDVALGNVDLHQVEEVVGVKMITRMTIAVVHVVEEVVKEIAGVKMITKMMIAVEEVGVPVADADLLE